MTVLNIPNNFEIPSGSLMSGKNNFFEVFSVICSTLEKLVFSIKDQSETTKKAMNEYSQMKTSDIVAEMNKDIGLSKLVRVRVNNSPDSHDEDAESVHESKEKPKKKK